MEDISFMLVDFHLFAHLVATGSCRKSSNPQEQKENIEEGRADLQFSPFLPCASKRDFYL